MDEPPPTRQTFLPWLEKDLEQPPGPGRPWVRVAWVATAALACVALLVLPFVVASMVGEFREGESQRLYDLRNGKPVVAGEQVDPDGAEYLNVAVVKLDEVSGSVTLAISGNRDCDPCGVKQMTFFALDDDASQRRGLSPFARVVVGAGEQAFSESVTLPVRGSPTRYPFDAYQLRLGIELPPPDSAKTSGAGGPPGGATASPAAGGVAPSGPPPAGTPPAGTPLAERPQLSGTGSGGPSAGRQVLATLQNQLNRFVMEAPVAVDAARLPSAAGPLKPTNVLDLSFRRPAYLPVLAVLLVLLVAASSALALATQSVDSLMLGVGGLILAIWGVRSVLVPSSLQAVTAVDLALSGVILLLLIGVALRAALHLQHRAGYRVARRRR